MIDFPHKILVPQRPSFLITRPLQRELLRQILQRRLITIVSPAGFGKTSLLIDFANETNLPTCWYTLDPSDEDVWEFLTYLSAAIDRVFPGAMAQTQALFQACSRVSMDVATSVLVRDIYAIGQDFILVIDDWHLVDHVSEVSRIISTILSRCPFCHLLLASRIYPTIHNLMLLTARREMSSLDEQMLRFNPTEVIEVLSSHFETSISLSQAEALTTRADGWITSILLSFQACGLSPIELDTSYTSYRQTFRYLAEQVLDQQPEDISTFLLQSSLLTELSVEMCDMVLQRNDSQRMLNTLLHRHLFVTEIKPSLLTYHPLFREFLQEYCSATAPQQYREILRRIADVYSSLGQWLQAFEHYIAANDYKAATKILASGGQQLYNAGRITTLSAWFSKLSNQELDISLLCLKARVQLDLGDHQNAHATILHAELYAEKHEQATVQLFKAHVARNAGDYAEALQIAETVLEETDDLAQRASALRIIGICLHRLGQTLRAIERLSDALEIQKQQRSQFEIAQLQRDLGICYTSIGQLYTAENYYTQADNYWASIGNAPYRAMSLNSKGHVQYRSGQYQLAHTTLQQALQQAHEAMVPSYEATIQSCLGDLYSDLHLWERATQAYTSAWKIGGNAHVMSDLRIAQVHLCVRQHKYELAERALRQLPDQTRTYCQLEVNRLEGIIACYNGRRNQSEEALNRVFTLLEGKHAPVDTAHAYLLQAQIAFTFQPADSAALLAALNAMLKATEGAGHYAFLITETWHMRGLWRRAAALGWPYAEKWQQHHRDMQTIAQLLDNDDKRPLLAIRTLGVDQIWLNGAQVHIGWAKAREVLYYLLAHPDGVASDVLRESIWPHLSVERCRDTLRSAIYQLRSALPRDMIVLHGRQIYQINREIMRIDYDVERFLKIADQQTNSEELLEATDIYRGSYLSNTESEWCGAMRSYLEQRYVRVLDGSGSLYEEQHLYDDALVLYQRILLTDPYNEVAHTGKMRCLIGLGQRAAAIQQYHELRRLMDEEFGLDINKTSEAEQIYRDLL